MIFWGKAVRLSVVYSYVVKIVNKFPLQGYADRQMVQYSAAECRVYEVNRKGGEGGRAPSRL
jgi:hypothetical protein